MSKFVPAHTPNPNLNALLPVVKTLNRCTSVLEGFPLEGFPPFPPFPPSALNWRELLSLHPVAAGRCSFDFALFTSI